MARQLTLALSLLLFAAKAFAQPVIGNYYPPTTVAGLANYVVPAGQQGYAIITNGVNAGAAVGYPNTCTNGEPALGGGQSICRVWWQATSGQWIIISPNPAGGGGGAGCPAGSTVVNLASDHRGITFGSCSGSGSSESCSYTQPVTCSCTAGNSYATISGYTPSNGDVGKHLIIGSAYGINGSTSTAGAGGTSWPAQTLRVAVGSVSGQQINFSNTALSGTNSPTTCQQTVTNAECDIGTDNGPALETAVNNASSGATLCIPAGNYLFDSQVNVTKNITFTGVGSNAAGGTVIYDARNDRWNNSPGYYDRMLFTFQQTTAGGVQNLTYLSTNTFSYWQESGDGTEGMSNWPIFTNSTSNLVFQNLVGLNIWPDSFVTLSIGSDSNSQGSNGSLVQNIYVQSGWTNGPALISGSNNTLKNIVGRNTCTDVEPNSTIEANYTSNNTYENITCIHDGTFAPGTGAGSPSFGWSGGACAIGTACAGSTNVAENNNFIGALSVLAPCNTSNQITITWTNNTGSSNSTGSPTCECDNSCGTGY